MTGNKSEYNLFSISEITQRTFQLAFAAIVAGLFIFGYHLLLNLYSTAMMLAAFCCCLCLILFLRQKRIIKNIKLPVITFISISLIVFAAEQGYQAGQYLYYFPLLIAIPVVVDSQQIYIKKVIFYYGLIAVSCLICIVVGINHQPWHPLSATAQYQVFFANIIAAISLTIGFAYVNITLERKYLQKLVEQKNQAIISRTNFLSTMGHELRTPLNGIIGAIGLLKNGRSYQEQEQYIDILKFCADQMLHQVNDILDFNKIEAGKLEIHPTKFNLKQLVVKATTPFTSLFNDKGLELKVEIDPEADVIVLADDVRLIQILNNLLSNALKFTQKGYVKLAVKTLSINNETLRARFFVEDTGAGIDKKDQNRIFDSFGQVYDEDTRNYNGTGLGLNICLEILKLMNSRLELISEKGIGSIFSFDIDFNYVKEPLLVVENEELDKADLSGMRILLAEDNQINMIVAVKILQDLKANCTKAFNGEEVLKLLEQDSAYDIILMDLEMPLLGGYATIQEIKKKWPEIPVLAFTATLLDLNTINKIKASGFADCISKPFEASILLSQIKKYALQPFIILLNFCLIY